jgi:DNA-binding GntR family transcriptional regulator
MTVRRDSVAQQIRDRLLEQIARHELRPGDRLIEAKIARQMGTSSIPVREAIRELMAMGMLEAAPHRGAWVREVSLQETIQAFEVRAVLEPLAVASAAPRLRGKCGPLRRAVRALVAAAREDDFAEFQHHNQVFHRTIVEASGNRVLLRVWDSLAFEVRTRFVMDFLTTVDPVAIAREHEPVIDALDRGDAKQAAALLRSHSSGLVQYLCDQAGAEPRAQDGASQQPGIESPRRRTTRRTIAATD